MFKFLVAEPPRRSWIGSMHDRFTKVSWNSSELIAEHSYSIVPTIIFLISTFLLMYFYCHDSIDQNTPWITKLYHGTMFQSMFFVVTRLWYWFHMLPKWLLKNLVNRTEDSSTLTHQEKYYNQAVMKVCMYLIVLAVAMIPGWILAKRYFKRNENRNNMLMVVAQDPWIQHEIGLSGHYLHRPPGMSIFNHVNLLFRSGRSSSADTDINITKPYFPRTYRSDMSFHNYSELQIAGKQQ